MTGYVAICDPFHELCSRARSDRPKQEVTRVSQATTGQFSNTHQSSKVLYGQPERLSKSCEGLRILGTCPMTARDPLAGYTSTYMKRLTIDLRTRRRSAVATLHSGNYRNRALGVK